MSMLTGVYVGCGKDDTPDVGQQYTLTVLSAQPDWGIVSGGGSYAAGTEVEIVATANDGFNFNHWSDDTNNHNAVRTLTLSSDTIIYANFSPRPEIGIYTFTVNGVTFSVQKVHPGTFLMGPIEGDNDYFPDTELPVHQVTLTQAYFIGTTEVTQALYETVMGTNPSYFNGSNLPVERVSYYDALAFCDSLSELLGKTFTLPTEAQWEYAARGGGITGQSSYLYSGSNNIDEVAWYRDNSGGTTHPVGQKKMNGLGLYDMSGNVSEWVLDWSAPYTADAVTDPTGPEDGLYRELRYGNWDCIPRSCRISTRSNLSPELKMNYLGFRVVMYE